VAGKSMARAMADGLTRNYPEHATTFKKNLAVYLQTLDAAIARWQLEAAPLRGVKFISYHPDMIYFAERFGMEAAGTIEIRPGVDPTPGHIVALEERMRREASSLSCANGTTRLAWQRRSPSARGRSWWSSRPWWVGSQKHETT